MIGTGRFPAGMEKFFTDLATNNDKQWFEKNRGRYETDVLEPAKSFVVEMGERLRKHRPDIVAIPKIDKSIFRIHRDIRFSKDKSPYKTHQGIYMWEGKRKKLESSGFYFHVEPGSFLLAAGMHMMPSPVLKQFREVVSQPRKARELDKLVSELRKDTSLEIGGRKYKQFPRDFDHDFEPNEYLLNDGVYVHLTATDFGQIEGEKAVEFCFDFYMKAMPLHEWLVRNI